ncbi:type II secretion system protein GspG [Acanthopleuribacter pedis]|uniref:Type II secretion system protein GspG n=1 Tax=Acanthopleuribacter pedis TaxID=442870 RepID=A0A8J7Q6Q5_9BACT|nr:type II secretion system protein GspG [Acanthopleuribacter pedis]MBO1319201.1 type II secretion system protein GspG [Acanthopleuribacter pedis]
MKYLIQICFALLVIGGLAACKDEKAEKAKQLYDRAELYAERRQFAQAIEIMQRIQIDYGETEYGPRSEKMIDDYRGLERLVLDNDRQEIRSKFSRIHRALDNYRVRFLSYPITTEDMKKLPSVVNPEWVDPWGNPIYYKPTYSSNRIPRRAPDGYVLASFGKDGLPGGTGQDLDLFYKDNKEIETLFPQD